MAIVGAVSTEAALLALVATLATLPALIVPAVVGASLPEAFRLRAVALAADAVAGAFVTILPPTIVAATVLPVALTTASAEPIIGPGEAAAIVATTVALITILRRRLQRAIIAGTPGSVAALALPVVLRGAVVVAPVLAITTHALVLRSPARTLVV